MTATGSYQRLLVLTWLLLDVPDADGEHRLVRAHRLARRALRPRPLRRSTYERARRRAVRHILTKEQRPWPDWFQQRFRVEPLPVGGDAGRLRAELARLDPPSRAAYLLTQLEGLERDEALGELGAKVEPVRDPNTVRDEIAAANGLQPRQQRELLAGADFDPGWVRLSRRDRAAALRIRPARRHVHGLAYGAVVLLALAVAMVPLLPASSERNGPAAGELVTVAADEWRSGDVPNYRAWPTTGDLRGDEELLRAAVRTWRAHGTGTSVTLVGAPAPAWWAEEDVPVRILYAGEIADRTTVVMRQGDTLGRYERRVSANGDEPRERMVVSPVDATESADQDGATNGVLLPVASGADQGTRFLVPPWLTDLEVTPLRGEQPKWRPVEVGDDAVTEPLAFPGEAGCLDGFLVKGTAAYQKGKSATEAFLYRPGVSQTARLFVTRPGDERTAEDGQLPAEGIDAPWIRRVLHGVTCDGRLLREGFTPRSVELDIVGRGDLPADQGPAALLHLHVEYVGADAFNETRQRTAAVLSGPRPEGQPAAEVSVVEADSSSNSHRKVADRAIGAWWQAPGGRWFYLVAGYPEIKRIELSGGLDRTVGGGFTAVRGPRRDSRDDLPTVRVRAFETRKSPSPGPSGAAN